MKKKEKPNCDFINCKYIILTLLPEQNQREKQKKKHSKKSPKRPLLRSKTNTLDYTEYIYKLHSKSIVPVPD